MTRRKIWRRFTVKWCRPTRITQESEGKPIGWLDSPTRGLKISTGIGADVRRLRDWSDSDSASEMTDDSLVRQSTLNPTFSDQRSGSCPLVSKPRWDVMGRRMECGRPEYSFDCFTTFRAASSTHNQSKKHSLLLAIHSSNLGNEISRDAEYTGGIGKCRILLATSWRVRIACILVADVPVTVPDIIGRMGTRRERDRKNDSASEDIAVRSPDDEDQIYQQPGCAIRLVQNNITNQDAHGPGSLRPWRPHMFLFLPISQSPG